MAEKIIIIVLSVFAALAILYLLFGLVCFIFIRVFTRKIKKNSKAVNLLLVQRQDIMKEIVGIAKSNNILLSSDDVENISLLNHISDFQTLSKEKIIDILKQEEKKLQIELADLEHDEKLLKTNIEKLKDPDYIAKYARENFQYSKAGEIILKLDSLGNNENVEEKNDFQYKIIFEVGFGILFIIILYVFIKNRK